MLQHFIHMPHRNEGHGFPDAFGNFLQILFVVLWHQHCPDTGAVGCQGLFLQPADGKHTAAEGDLSGHGHMAGNRHIG
ncbi:hypothetical protein D3C76_1804780 [compost metagenome]